MDMGGGWWLILVPGGESGDPGGEPAQAGDDGDSGDNAVRDPHGSRFPQYGRHRRGTSRDVVKRAAEPGAKQDFLVSRHG
jgi:hypothetical protein